MIENIGWKKSANTLGSEGALIFVSSFGAERIMECELLLMTVSGRSGNNYVDR